MRRQARRLQPTSLYNATGGMTAEYDEYEFMFGDTWCLITISAHVGVSGEPGYKACPYVLGYRGRSLRTVGDRDGKPLEFVSESKVSALALASDYMEDRFGPRRAAPPPTTSYVTSFGTSSLEDEPPLQDDRPAPIVVLALERVQRGDYVIVTKDGAKRARRQSTGRSAGTFLASAVEDIEKGRHGRVREIPENDL